MGSIFGIKKTSRGFCVTQTQTNVFTNNKPKTISLGCFKTLKEANKTKSLAMKLVK